MFGASIGPLLVLTVDDEESNILRATNKCPQRQIEQEHPGRMPIGLGKLEATKMMWCLRACHLHRMRQIQ